MQVVSHKKQLYQNGAGRDFTFIIPNNPILESYHLLSFLFFLCACIIIFRTELSALDLFTVLSGM